MGIFRKVSLAVIGGVAMGLVPHADCTLRELCQLAAPEPPHVEGRAPGMDLAAEARAEVAASSATGGGGKVDLVAADLAAASPVIGSPALAVSA